MFRGRGNLDGRRREQGRTENCQDCLSHLESPCSGAWLRGKSHPAVRRSIPQIAMVMRIIAFRPSRNGEQICGSKSFAAKSSAGE
jgi:hypothetical protein